MENCIIIPVPKTTIWDRLIKLNIKILGYLVAKAIKNYNSITTPGYYIDIAEFIDKMEDK